MGDAPEVVREVGVNDFRMASEQQPFHLDHRLLGVSPGTVRVLPGSPRWRHAGRTHLCCSAFAGNGCSDTARRCDFTAGCHAGVMETVGLVSTDTRVIRVPVSYSDFEDFWASNSVPVGPLDKFIQDMLPSAKEQL